MGFWRGRPQGESAIFITSRQGGTRDLITVDVDPDHLFDLVVQVSPL